MWSCYRKMDLRWSLVLCALAQVTCCGARSVPLQPLSFPNPLPRGCNDSDVLFFSGLALKHINADQQDGYVLGLNRVHDAWEHIQGSRGSLFYLTLDVLETSCHVLSRKDWTDCGGRPLYESIYGQCKAAFYVNKSQRILLLLAYNCTLRPVSRRKLLCPDCPFPSTTDFSDDGILKAATETLAKYNNESASKQYSLDKVTRVSRQWVSGPAYYVEYLIRESPCNKSQASSCPLQPSASAPVGFCHGSLIESLFKKYISVTCNIFKSQVQTPGSENSPAEHNPPHLPGGTPPPKENTAPSSSPAERKPRGSIQHLPAVDHEKPEDSQDKDQEIFPVQLDLTTNPLGGHLDISSIFIGPQKEQLVVLPFPKAPRSAECPGPARETSSLVLPP
ncbi:fetuin-B [Cavia porcellus]|uniref:fetuin-B n=1 Tax=Cavia porcellus TaxID=10141 RepID=UPI0006619061|nr:fetuin-B [Cavia porcellus]